MSAACDAGQVSLELAGVGVLFLRLISIGIKLRNIKQKLCQAKESGFETRLPTKILWNAVFRWDLIDVRQLAINEALGQYFDSLDTFEQRKIFIIHY